jgi:hypothetical protein
MLTSFNIALLRPMMIISLLLPVSYIYLGMLRTLMHIFVEPTSTMIFTTFLSTSHPSFAPVLLILTTILHSTITRLPPDTQPTLMLSSDVPSNYSSSGA